MVHTLWNSTDFYHIQTDTSQKIGFPLGVANEVTLRMFQRYEKQARYEEQAAILKNVASTDDSIPPACQEVELSTTSSVESHPVEIVNPPITLKEKQLTNVGDHFNGDDRGDYRWSQSIRDIDLLVNVPKEIQKAKQLRVKIDPHHLKIENQSNEEWRSIIDHSFPHKISVADSVWSLHPGELIQVTNLKKNSNHFFSHVPFFFKVNLEKKEERWWDRLFTTDPPIDVKAIDTAVPASDLSQEEHMKIEELMVGQEARKRNNPTVIFLDYSHFHNLYLFL